VFAAGGPFVVPLSNRGTKTLAAAGRKLSEPLMLMIVLIRLSLMTAAAQAGIGFG